MTAFGYPDGATVGLAPADPLVTQGTTTRALAPASWLLTELPVGEARPVRGTPNAPAGATPIPWVPWSPYAYGAVGPLGAAAASQSGFMPPPATAVRGFVVPAYGVPLDVQTRVAGITGRDVAAAGIGAGIVLGVLALIKALFK